MAFIQQPTTPQEAPGPGTLALGGGKCHMVRSIHVLRPAGAQSSLSAVRRSQSTRMPLHTAAGHLPTAQWMDNCGLTDASDTPHHLQSMSAGVSDTPQHSMTVGASDTPPTPQPLITGATRHMSPPSSSGPFLCPPDHPSQRVQIQLLDPCPLDMQSRHGTIARSATRSRCVGGKPTEYYRYTIGGVSPT